jgi:EpsI family protein
MIGDRVTATVLTLLLVLIGGLAWSLQLRPGLEVDTQALHVLPPNLQDYSSREVPLDETVEAILRADANVQREYRDPQGNRVWLYIGYYGTARGGRPDHTPEICYPAYGWRFERQRTVAISPTSGLRANEYVAEKNGQQDLVEFWYRSNRRTGMLGGLDVSLDHVLGRLSNGRADGALIRISTPIRDGEEEVARARLNAFATAFDSQLATHWPRESPPGN